MNHHEFPVAIPDDPANYDPHFSEDCCRGCAFEESGGCLLGREVPPCLYFMRPEGRHVIFTPSLQIRCNEFFGSTEVWDYMKDAYQDRTRSYHTLKHLSRMLQHLDGIEGLSADHRQALELATWFHDFVYSTSLIDKGENERLSTVRMLELSHQCRRFSGDLMSLAGEMILASREHAVPSYVEKEEDVRAIELFLDLGLSVLAASEEEVLAYDEEIREEWMANGDISLVQFAVGRIRVLTGFLDRDRLFFSPEFSSKTGIAKSNLNLLINKWKAS